MKLSCVVKKYNFQSLHNLPYVGNLYGPLVIFWEEVIKENDILDIRNPKY